MVLPPPHTDKLKDTFFPVNPAMSAKLRRINCRVEPLSRKQRQRKKCPEGVTRSAMHVLTSTVVCKAKAE